LFIWYANGRYGWSLGLEASSMVGYWSVYGLSGQRNYRLSETCLPHSDEES
jgi:hypothetical protein